MALARWFGWLVAFVFFVISGVIGALLHGDLVAARRLLSRTVTSLLADQFRGKIVLHSVEGLGWSHLDLGVVSVEDPDAHRVLDIWGVHARFRLPSLLRGAVLAPKGKRTLTIQSLHVDQVNGSIDALPDGSLRLAHAFESRNPTPPPAPGDPPPTPLRMEGPDIQLGGLWVSGRLPSGDAVDGEITGLRAAVVSDDLAGLTVDVPAVRAVNRSFAPFTGVVALELHARWPVEAESPERRAELRGEGNVADVPFSLFGRIDGNRIAGFFRTPEIAPERLRSLMTVAPGVVVSAPVRVDVSASGTLPEVHVTAHVSAGAGTVAVRSVVQTAPVLEGDLRMEVRDMDPQTFAPSAPAARVGANGDVHFRLAEGNPQGRAELTTFPTTVAGQAVPGVHAVVHFDQGVLNAEADIAEPGAPTHVQATRQADGRIQVHGQTTVAALSAVPRLHDAAAGAARVQVDAAIADGAVDATVKAEAHEIVAPGAKVDEATFQARVRGPFAALTVDADVNARGVAAASTRLDHVHVQASAAQTSKGVRVDHLGAEIRQADTTGVQLVVNQVEVGGGQVRVRGLALEGEMGSIHGDVSLNGTRVQAALDGHIDVGALSRLVPVPNLDRGQATFHVDLRDHGATRDGEIAVHLDGFGSPTLPALVSADLRATFEKTALRAQTTLAVMAPDGISLARLSAEGDGVVPGPLAAAGSWQHAQGSLRLNEAVIDLDALSAQPLARILYQARPDLPQAGGRVHLRADISRRPGEAWPDAQLAVHTEGLTILRTLPAPPGSSAPPTKDRLAGIDVTVAAVVQAAPGNTKGIGLGFSASDQTGALVAGNFHTKANLSSLLEAVQNLTGAGAVTARRQLGALPVAGRVTVPPRDIASWPAFLRPEGVRGTLSAHLDVGGKVADPRAEFAADVVALEDIHRVDRTLTPLDVQMAAAVGQQRSTAKISLRQKDRSLVDAIAEANVNVTNLVNLTADGSPPRWNAGGSLRMDNFDVRLLPLVEAHGFKGKLSGALTVMGIHDRPEVLGQITLREAEAEGVALPKGELQARITGRGESLVSVALQQGQTRSAVRNAGSGELIAEARGHLLFPEGLAPILAPNGKNALALTVRHFELRPFAPMASSVVGDLGGIMEGQAAASFVAVGGRFDPAQFDVDGRIAWAHGRVSIPQVGQTFHDGHFTLVVNKDDDRLNVSLRDLSLRAARGRMTGWADVTLPLGLQPTAPGAVQGPLGTGLHARAGLAVAKNEKIPVSYEGAPLGSLFGTVEADVAVDRKNIKAFVALPSIVLNLPKTKSRNVQPLDPDPDVVFRHETIDQEKQRGLERKQAQAGGARDLTLQVGIGASVDDLLKRNPRYRGSFLVQREELGVRFQGRPVFSLTDKLRGQGVIETIGGRAVVIGKTFFVEKGVIRFEGDEVDNPALDFRARWDVPDSSHIYAEVKGNAKAIDFQLRSDPPRSKSAVFNLVLFGKENLDAPSKAGQPSASNGSVVASAALNYLFDPVEIFGQRFEFKTTSTASGVRPGFATEVRPNLWAQFDFNGASSGPNRQNVDRATLTLDWRFRRAWALRSTLGDRGSSIFDLLWQYRY